MKKNFTLTIMILMMALGIAACSDGHPINLGNDINDLESSTPDHGDYSPKNEEIILDPSEIDIIEDTTTLHPNLQEILEQAKYQKGYLILKGSDLPAPDTTLVFIGSGEKNTGGYDIQIQSIQADEESGHLDIVVKETSPNPGDIVTEAFTYPFVLFSIKGDYSSCKVADMDGNRFEPVILEGPQLPSSETGNDLSVINIIPNKEMADALVERFINAVNAEDPWEVLECLNPEMIGYYTTETVETAFLDYKVCFGDSPIVQYELTSYNTDASNSFTYQLISEAGKTSEIDVVFGDDALWISCEILDYSYQSKHLLNKFIYALENENENWLAKVLSVDDLEYPESNASVIIEEYKKHFDLESLEYQFIEQESEEQAFLYRIVGKKGDNSAEHQIRIIYKDGLVRLDDPWAP